EMFLKLDPHALAEFLNSDPSKLESELESSEYKDQISLSQLLDLQKELRELFIDLLESDDPKRARQILSSKLQKFEHGVEIDPETKEVYTVLHAEGVLNDFWLRLITDFLYDGLGWTGKLGRCLNCGLFFAKRKAKQRFCREKCRYEYRDSRKKARRVKVWRGS
ncbi:hypothetical protein DRP77_03635, partial [Candidatus Poribacteria bacterium]